MSDYNDHVNRLKERADDGMPTMEHLMRRGLKYAISGAISVPISDEALRDFANRLAAEVDAGSPAAVVVWNGICARAAAFMNKEFLEAHREFNQYLNDEGDEG